MVVVRIQEGESSKPGSGLEERKGECAGVVTEAIFWAAH